MGSGRNKNRDEIVRAEKIRRAAFVLGLEPGFESVYEVVLEAEKKLKRKLRRKISLTARRLQKMSPKKYQLNLLHIERLKQAAEADKSLMKVSVTEDNALWAESFASLDQMLREAEDRARNIDTAYAWDQFKAQRKSLLLRKKELIEAWTIWTKTFSLVRKVKGKFVQEPGYGKRPTIQEPDLDESSPYRSRSGKRLPFSPLDIERYKKNEARNLEFEPHRALAPNQEWIARLEANTLFGVDATTDVYEAPTEAGQLDEIDIIREKAVALIRQSNNAWLQTCAFMTLREGLSYDEKRALARAPSSNEFPFIRITALTSKKVLFAFDYEGAQLRVERDPVVYDPMGNTWGVRNQDGTEFKLDVDFVKVLRDNLVDVLRRRAYSITLLDHVEYNEVEASMPDPLYEGKVIVYQRNSRVAQYSSYSSILRYPDAQRVAGVPGSHKRKRLFGERNANGIQLRLYSCGTCSEQAKEDEQHASYLQGMDPKRVQVKHGTFGTYVITEHVRDVADLRMMQVRLLTGKTWKEIEEDKLWNRMGRGAIRGYSGAWRCLVCGSYSADESIEVILTTRVSTKLKVSGLSEIILKVLTDLQVGPRDVLVDSKVAYRQRGVKFDTIQVPTIWKARVEVYGPEFLKQLRRARPELWKVVTEKSKSKDLDY